MNQEAIEVTAGTASRILGLPVAEIERMCREGTLRGRRIGERGWWRIDCSSLVEIHRQELEAASKKK